MPKVSVTPDVEVRVYESAATSRRIRYGISVADIMGHVLRRADGDSAGLSQTPGALAAEWQPMEGVEGNYDTLENVEFIRFAADGRVHEGSGSTPLKEQDGDYSGFILKGRVDYRHNKIGTPAFGTSGASQTWQKLRGDWDTVLPPQAPRRARLFNTGADAVAKARTETPLPAESQIEFELHPHGSLNTITPEARLGWANDTHCFYLVHGRQVTYEQKIGGVWRIAQKFDGLPPANLETGQFRLRARLIGGRIVVTCNEQSHHIITARGGEPMVATWPEGLLTAEFTNLRATVAAAPIVYANAGGTPLSGAVSRTIKLSETITPDERDAPPSATIGGHAGKDARINVAPRVNENGIGYDAVLTASADGLHTPLFNKVIFPFTPEWIEESTVSSDWIDLRPALLQITVDHAMPPTASGAEARLELSRSLLNSKVPNWREFVDEFRPVQIRIRRRYSDGTRDADWTHLMAGYIYKINAGSDAPNANTMAIVVRDGVLRLQKPAAVIDFRDGPLDYLLADRQPPGSLLGGNLGRVFPNGHKLYGVDCVCEILRRHLGWNEALKLNGGYPGNALRYFNSHYPLMDTAKGTGYLGAAAALSLGEVPMTNGVLFPPPFDEDALKWINDFAGFDHAVFFYGWAGSFSSDARREAFPYPMYGRIVNFLAGGETVTVTDNEYLSGDLELLMQRVAVETRPDKAYNRVVVMGKAAEGLEAYKPSLSIGVARVPTNRARTYVDGETLVWPYRNAPEQSWERTLIMREDLVQIPAVAQAIANGVISLIKDVKLQYPEVTLRGNPFWYWGDKVNFKMQSVNSDLSIGLASQIFRVERVTHSIDFEIEDTTRAFTTNLTLSPQTGVG